MNTHQNLEVKVVYLCLAMTLCSNNFNEKSYKLGELKLDFKYSLHVLYLVTMITEYSNFIGCKYLKLLVSSTI